MAKRKHRRQKPGGGVDAPPVPEGTLQFSADSAPESWPSVSLCMIVRNEEANLADCIRSAGDFAAEVIVVDTGSTDRTVEIAKSLGARVKHFEWVDDFAAARNESMKDAQGDWIFYLDADDRLSPEEVTRLKNVVASGLADAYRCRVVSHVADAGQSLNIVYHTRLFRNHRNVWFSGAVHENITAAILRQGMTVAQTNVTIQHVGYAGGPEVLRQKARRNGQILQRAIGRHPDDLKLRYYLGVSLYQLADYRAAIGQFEAVIAHPPPTLNRDSQLYKAYLLLISAYTHVPAPEKARRTLQRALELFPERRHLWITAGMFYLSQDEPEAAISALEHATQLSPQSDAEGESWPPGVLQDRLRAAYQRQGMKAIQQENYPQAVWSFSRFVGLAAPPQQAEGFKLLALALQKCGRQDEAIASWQAAQELESAG
ncbi:MAG: glycosyltransferase [Chloroflexi bacterium]|nr:MAG: glycosyltransferase [Chloroflexota bacterium]